MVGYIFSYISQIIYGQSIKSGELVEKIEEKIRELKNKTALGSIKTEKNLKVSY